MNKNIVEFAESVPDIFIKLVRLDIINKKEATEYALSQEFSFMEKFIREVGSLNFEVDDLVTYYNINRKWLYVIYSNDYEIISQCLNKILLDTLQEDYDSMTEKLVYLANNVNRIENEDTREKVKLYLENYVIATNNYKLVYEFATTVFWGETRKIKNLVLKNCLSKELLNYFVIEQENYNSFLEYESVEDTIIQRNEAEYIVELAKILFSSKEIGNKYTHLEILREAILKTDEKNWINVFNKLYKDALELFEERLKFHLRGLVIEKNYEEIEKNKDAYQELFLDKPVHEKEAIKRLRTLS